MKKRASQSSVWARICHIHGIMFALAFGGRWEYGWQVKFWTDVWLLSGTVLRDVACVSLSDTDLQ